MEISLIVKSVILIVLKLVILNFTAETAVKFEHFISDVERKHTVKHLIQTYYLKIHPATKTVAEYLKLKLNCDSLVW